MAAMNPDERMERALAETWWCPDDVQVIDTDDVVWVHSAERPQFNRCQRINPQMEGLESMVDTVSGTHARLNMPSRWSLCAPSCTDDLEHMLSNRGYALSSATRIYSMPADALRPAINPRIRVRVCEGMEDWTVADRVMCEAFGWPPGPPDPRRLEELERFGGAEALKLMVVAEDVETGEAVGAAGLSVHMACSLGILHAGGTLAHARGQGVYSAMLTARMRWSAERGLADVFLQAELDTSAPIVAAQGFTPHGMNRHWSRSPDASR